MFTDQIMIHIGTSVVHELQKYLGFERSLEKFSISVKWKILPSVGFLKIRHRCCAPIPALGD
jgi:hypothetical protein